MIDKATTSSLADKTIFRERTKDSNIKTK